MVVADLHVHTTNSDGQLTLEMIPEVASEADLAVVAVTDHDRLHPDLTGPVVRRNGVTVIHGIELRVEAGSQRLDLLGYGAERTERLAALTERLQTNRITRAKAIISRVEERTGASLSVDLSPGVGRPHIARAIAKSSAPYGYREAFESLIGDDGPCYVSRDIPSFTEGKTILQEACSIVGLAHPFRYRDPATALNRAAELDAVEIPYPYGHDVDRSSAERLIKQEGLVVTGGSDAHEQTLGIAGLGATQYQAVEEML